MRRTKKTEEISPKIEPIRGSLMAQYKRCGNRNCRCAKGFKHGPFFYHVWYVQGIRYKSYVKKADFDRIKAGIAAFRAQRRERQRSAVELKTMLQEIREASRNVYAILRSRGFKI
jgi:hypothetical protein